MAAVLLTGASGYLGAAIGAALTQRAVAYDVLPGRLEQLAEKSLRGYRQVLHAAGAVRRRGHIAIDSSNRVGTDRLLAALDGKPELLFISSRLVYGHQSGRSCTEEDPVQPVETYGIAKLAAEEAIRASGLPHVILRIPGLIGDSPAGIGHGFYADAVRHFMAEETVVRYTPDRMHDNLDVRALAKVCADWSTGTLRLAPGVSNVSGASRSLHATLAELAAAAAQCGARPAIRDQFAVEMPWPFMSDRRFLEAGGSLAVRTDREIAEACCNTLMLERRPA